MGNSKHSSEREIYTKTILSQETRKISNEQPIPTPKTSREGKTEPKIRRREITRSRSEINKIETKNNKDQ